MKALITGPLGHIGSKLIHSIQPGEFEEVRLLDNLSTQRYSSLFNLPKGIRFEFIEDDIRTADLDKYLEDIDIVIHLAAITDAAASVDKKDLVEEVNFIGTKKVAEACARNKCKLFFPSTTSVYGTQEEVVDENCTVDGLKPQSPYADSKLRAEQLLMKIGLENHLKFIICRLGTIFGISIGMRFHTAVNKFVWQACLGQSITVWRTAMNQKRPYLDLSDAIKAIMFVMSNDLFNNEIYNVVSVNCTVKEIIDIIKKYIADAKIEYVESKIMNQLTYTVLNEKFKKTGFIFNGELEKGISDTIGILSGVVKINH
jgi:nucleoside-diphosphate-sugar epimerase